jgi:hypothetical protein
MNKIQLKIMKSFIILLSAICIAKASFAQVRSDSAKQKWLHEDPYFSPVSFAYEVWIGSGKFLYLKTNANITEATIEYVTPLKKYGPPFSETSTPRKLSLIKQPGSDTYQFDITNDLYKTRQRITLKLVIDYYTKVEVQLYNQKIRVLK